MSVAVAAATTMQQYNNNNRTKTAKPAPSERHTKTMITNHGSAIKQRKHFTTLGDICFIEKGKIGIQAAIPGDYPLVTTAAERSSHNEYHFEGEAVCIPLVSATGHGHASIKRVHFQKGKFCVGNILCACIPKDYNKTSAKFLHLYFSLLKDTILVPLMQGSANVSLKIKDLENVEVPDVPFEGQLEIVDEFERLEVINNVLLKELTQQQSYLQLLRQTILQEAVQGKLTQQDPADEPATALLQRIKAEKEKGVKTGKFKKEKELPPITEDEIPFALPEGWIWCRLGEIIKISSGNGLTASQMAKDGTIPVYGGNGINGYHNKFNVDRRTIVIGRVGFYCGSIHYTEEKAWITDNAFITYFSEENISTEFLVLLLKATNLKQDDSGTAQPVISGRKLYPLLVPLPPLAEQQRIVAKVQQLQQRLSELEAQVQQSREYAQQLLQSVLGEAFAQKNEAYEIKEPGKLSLVAEE